MHYLKHLARLRASDIHPGGAQATAALIEALMLRKGQRLLELGCGTGRTILRLARIADVHVVGLDLLSEMLAIARSRLRASLAANRCALVRGRVAMLPFSDESFDRVYAESVLGMQPNHDARAMLTEAFRVLKPGGLFVACEAIWKPHVDQSTVTEVNQQSELDFGLRPASERAWSVDHWLDEIRGAGLRPLESSSIPRISAAGIAANLVSRISRLRLLFSPTLVRDHYRYRQRLANHRGDHELLETRLFVATRAA